MNGVAAGTGTDTGGTGGHDSLPPQNPSVTPRHTPSHPLTPHHTSSHSHQPP
jgi:hypothetical protein